MNLLDGIQQKIEEKIVNNAQEAKTIHRKIGRPTTYKEEYCDAVVEHMKSGLSVESFAAKIDTHKDTIYEWMKRHEEFSDAVKRGYAKSLLFWETIGIQGTVGKLERFSASGYALQMANKHKWTQRTDITSDDKKIESPMVYMPKEREDL